MKVPNHPRHVRMAQVIEFVGSRARAEGCAEPEIVAECQKALSAYGGSQIVVETDPSTGDVTNVTLNL